MATATTDGDNGRLRSSSSAETGAVTSRRQADLVAAAAAPRRARANSPVVVETFMGAGVLAEARADGFNVVELMHWRLSNGSPALVYLRNVTEDPVSSVLLDSANLLEQTRRISGISVGDAV